MAHIIVRGDEDASVLGRAEIELHTAIDRTGIDSVDRALEAGAGRLSARHISGARPAAAPRPAPVWFGALESFHATSCRPLPLFVDAGLASAVVAGVAGPGAIPAAAVFVLCGVALGLYCGRTTAESQGVRWYARAAAAPAVALTAALTLAVPAGRAAAGAGATLALLLGVRFACWLVITSGRRRGLGLRPALLLGDPAGCAALHRRMLAFPEAGLYPAGWSDPNRPGWDVDDVLAAAVDHVLVLPTTADGGVVVRVVAEAGDAGLPVSLVVPQAGFARHPFRPSIGDSALVPIVRPLARRVASWEKRAFDVVATALLLLALSPVLIVTAAAVWLADRGPILYRQRRVGRDGRVFAMWKFRSMVVDADRMVDDVAHRIVGSGLLYKVHDDPRVTPVGRLIRRLSIDELPQLFNVLRGEMSLVGPRPLAVEPTDFDDLARRRHAVRPGITGPWQVQGGNALTYEEMVGLDLAYIATWSFWGDLRVLLRTLPAIAVRRAPC